ncbi:sugar transferase [Variovorax sp. GB1R11]
MTEGSPFDDELCRPKQSRLLSAAKRAVDIGGACLFFLAFGWLYALIWVGVVSTSRGPGIYSQTRLGRNGNVFKLYKFRSMIPDATQALESYLDANPDARKQWENYQKLDGDPRITTFGKFIRRASLDELPQFWNVLKGDMSLIGPRPCMVEQKRLYGSYWKYYCAVRPGLTGLWQVSGRNHLSYRQRVELDSQYVKNISVYGDILIFIKTLWVVISGHGSR